MSRTDREVALAPHRSTVVGADLVLEALDDVVTAYASEVADLAASGVDIDVIDAVLTGSAGITHPASSLLSRDRRGTPPSPRPATPPPLEVVDHGAVELSTLLTLSGVPVLTSRAQRGVVELPHEGTLASVAGLTALELGVRWGPNVVVLDLLPDPEHTSKVAVAAHPDCTPAVLDSAVGLLQAAGLEVYVVPDTPGLITARVLSAVINAAYARMSEGGERLEEIDERFRRAVACTSAPSDWMRKVGPIAALDVLTAMRSWYGETATAPTPSLRRAALRARTASERPTP